MPSFHTQSSTRLLLCLLNFLADFDGQISESAAEVLAVLRVRADRIPDLYADVFRLPFGSTCAEFVERIESLTEEQVKVASYAFHIFYSYEQLLKVNIDTAAAPQKVAYESQLERIRVVVERTQTALSNTIVDDRNSN
jgi:hypothetical protein